MKGKEVADADVSVRITHPRTLDLAMFLIAPNGATDDGASATPARPGNAGYGSGDADCSGAMTTFSDETFNFLSPTATRSSEPGEILSPWAATVEPQGWGRSASSMAAGRGRTLAPSPRCPANGQVGTLSTFQGPDQAPDALSLEGRPLAGGLFPQLRDRIRRRLKDIRCRGENEFA